MALQGPHSESGMGKEGAWARSSVLIGVPRISQVHSSLANLKHRVRIREWER